MDGSIWLYLALILIAVGFALAGLRPRPSEPKQSRHCPNCETPMSMRRVPIFESLMFRGVWMCPHCGTRIKRRERVVG
jgi:predicted RNA-binding Zn-ribbon protein involved in translation (DUF1610 family)